MEMQIALLTYGILNFVLALYGVYKTMQDKHHVNFIWWWGGIFNGSFVWEDMIIYGMLHSGFVSLSLILNDLHLWVICFFVFWTIRGAGETLYFMLQQFLVPTHQPHKIHAHLNGLRVILGDISDQKAFIIMQVFWQSIMMVSAISLIVAIIKY